MMTDHINTLQTSAQRFVDVYTRTTQGVTDALKVQNTFDRCFKLHGGITSGVILDGEPKRKIGTRLLFSDDSFVDMYFESPTKMFCGVSGAKDIKKDNVS